MSRVAAQLDLPLGRTVGSLKRHLEDLLGKPASLTLTDNTTSMVSCRIREGVMDIRFHRMFLQADDDVISEIASFLKNRRARMPLFRKFIRDNQEGIRKRPRKTVSLRTAGRFHDLQILADHINHEYFGGAITAGITWGWGRPRRAVRKRTVGSYSESSNLIRINPVLDRKNVPGYYVSFIIYHEMLHASLGTATINKRRSIHSREFRRREKLHRDYERALVWERGGA